MHDGRPSSRRYERIDVRVEAKERRTPNMERVRHRSRMEVKTRVRQKRMRRMNLSSVGAVRWDRHEDILDNRHFQQVIVVDGVARCL